MTLSGDHSSYSAVAAYARPAVVLHWLLAIALVAQLLLGWWMVDLPKSPPGLRAGWFNLHKSIGLVLAVLVAVRLAWRTTHAMPQPGVGAPWQRAAAQAAHGALYACMLVMPVSGLLGSTFTRYPIRFFGAVLPLPHNNWPAAKQLMSDLHLTAAYAFVVLVALHVAAAAWHWLRGDGVAARMGIPSLR